MEIRNTRELKQFNRIMVLNKILETQPVSRRDLTMKLDISHATVANIVKDLICDGLVLESRMREPEGGRPAWLLEFKGDDKFLIAVEIKRCGLFYGIFNLNLELMRMAAVQVAGFTAEEIMDLLYKRIVSELRVLHIPPERLVGVGVSTFGVYDEVKDRIFNCTNMLWDGCCPKKELTKRFKLPVYVENDANVAAYYEWIYGVGRGYANLLYVHLEEGIGGSLIINDRLYKGAHGMAGEIGLAYGKSDELVTQLMDEAHRGLILVLANTITFFDPDLLILGDMYDLLNEKFMANLRKKIKEMCFPNVAERLKIIRITENGDSFQMKGVASFVFDNWKKAI